MSNVSIALINKVATKADWDATTSPIPNGEIVLEKTFTNSTSYNMKIGNGNRYSLTPYAGIYGCGTRLSDISISDLNSLTYPGSYYANYADPLNNLPPDNILNPTRRIIKIYANTASGDVITQEIWSADDANYVFYRRNAHFQDNVWTWTDWHEFNSPINKTFSGDLSLSDGVESSVILNDPNAENKITINGQYLIQVTAIFNSAGASGKITLGIGTSHTSNYSSYGTSSTSNKTTLTSSRTLSISANNNSRSINFYQEGNASLKVYYWITCIRLGPGSEGDA